MVVSRESCQPLVLASTQKKHLALGSIPIPEKERRKGKGEGVDGETGKQKRKKCGLEGTMAATLSNPNKKGWDRRITSLRPV